MRHEKRRERVWKEGVSYHPQLTFWKLAALSKGGVME